MKVLLGEHRLNVDPDCDAESCSDKPRVIKAEKLIVHSEYSKRTITNDIALIRLKEEVAFTRKWPVDLCGIRKTDKRKDAVNFFKFAKYVTNLRQRRFLGGYTQKSNCSSFFLRNTLALILNYFLVSTQKSDSKT